MPTPSATVEDFKDRFVRDFAYSEDDDLSGVTEADIQNALNDASLVFNPGLWVDTLETMTAFLFLAAHFLVLNLQAAGGVSAINLGRGANSHGGGTIQTKTVGNVSVAFALSPEIVNDPILNQFQQTNYGQKYLQLLTPRLVGNVSVVAGWNDTGAPDVLV